MNQIGKSNGSPSGDTREQRLLRQEFGHLSTRVIHDLPASRQGMRLIGFCAGNPGEGCTSVATNYALFCGQQGVRTTIVETVFRHPTLAGSFGVSEGPGLWDLLDGTAETDEVIRHGVADSVNLLPAGTAPRDIVLAGENFDLSGVFDFLSPHNDLVVVDVPPLLSSPEANLILPQLDGVVVVVQANRSRLCAVERTVDSIHKLGVRVVGSVLNKVRYDLPSALDKLL
jgi:Mrp family chromosome partitioning ATPase